MPNRPRARKKVAKRAAAKVDKSSAPVTRPLTGKQEAFVRWYTTTGETLFNATRSAEKAGYKGSEGTLAQVGYENLRKPEIAKAIQAQLRRQYSAADLTIERVLRDIEMVRQLAIAEGRFQAALRASDMHGKYLKMWTQKIEHLHTIEDATTEELLVLFRQIAGNIDGFDLSELIGGDGPAPGGVPDPSRNPTTH